MPANELPLIDISDETLEQLLGRLASALCEIDAERLNVQAAMDRLDKSGMQAVMIVGALCGRLHIDPERVLPKGGEPRE